MTSHDPKCAHCVLYEPLKQFLLAEPTVPVQQVCQDLGQLIAELIRVGIPKENWQLALDTMAQSIRADVYGYDRTAVVVLLPLPKGKPS